jgi:hypothetical protein
MDSKERACPQRPRGAALGVRGDVGFGQPQRFEQVLEPAGDRRAVKQQRRPCVLAGALDLRVERAQLVGAVGARREPRRRCSTRNGRRRPLQTGVVALLAVAATSQEERGAEQTGGQVPDAGIPKNGNVFVISA